MYIKKKNIECDRGDKSTNRNETRKKNMKIVTRNTMFRMFSLIKSLDVD